MPFDYPSIICFLPLPRSLPPLPPSSISSISSCPRPRPLPLPPPVVVLGSHRVVHPRGTGAVPQVRHILLETAAPGVWAAEPAHLPAEGARRRGREAPLERYLHEPAQGDSFLLLFLGLVFGRVIGLRPKTTMLLLNGGRGFEDR